MKNCVNLTSFLQETFLFCNLEIDEISALIERCPPQIVDFKRCDMIYSSITDARLGIVLDGKCEVRKDKPDGNRVVLNMLECGDSFGILSVLTNDELPTSIFALKNSTVLFFSSDQIDYFVNNSSQISRNIISFLANRIVFLNKKIATFSGTRVEDRLAVYLLSKAQLNNSNEFAFNCQKTAEEINAGRASIHRALDALEQEGLIKFDNKKIYISDPNGLERMTK